MLKKLKPLYLWCKLLSLLDGPIQPEPHAEMEIDSLIAEYLKNSNQESIIKEYNLEPFKISAITKGSYLSQDESYEMLKKNI